jgi:short-subunit dehydrogenase
MAKALVTGASAGIGLEFIHQLAAKGYDVILVSRNKNKLDEIASDVAKKYSVKAEVLVADLGTDQGIKHTCDFISQNDIEFVVNNAGLGINKPFHATDLAEEVNLLNVLVKAPLEISHAAIVQMMKKNNGFIVNVGSVAAWTTSGTYSAAKVWLTSFSESLNTNYKNSGINVTVVAPGFTRTEFHQRAQMPTNEIPNWMWISTQLVVTDSIKAVLKAKPVVIPHVKYKLLFVFLRITPRSIIRKFSNSYQSRRQ